MKSTLICFTALLAALSAQEAFSAENLSGWGAEAHCQSGFADTPWFVQSGNVAVRVEDNINCNSFFRPPVATELSQATFSIGETDNGGDYDYFGFALGFTAGEADASDADYLLFEFSANGLALVHVELGPCLPGEVSTRAQTATCKATEIARAITLGNTGWAHVHQYDFEVVQYTTQSLKLKVDGVLEFDLTASDVGLSCFPAGGLAMYNNSQAKVTYEGIEIQETDQDRGCLEPIACGSAKNRVCGSTADSWSFSLTEPTRVFLGYLGTGGGDPGSVQLYEEDCSTVVSTFLLAPAGDIDGDVIPAGDYCILVPCTDAGAGYLLEMSLFDEEGPVCDSSELTCGAAAAAGAINGSASSPEEAFDHYSFVAAGGGTIELSLTSGGEPNFVPCAQVVAADGWQQRVTGAGSHEISLPGPANCGATYGVLVWNCAGTGSSHLSVPGTYGIAVTNCGPGSGSAICREATGPCDVPEYCSGSLLECPSDAFATSATVCRSAVSVCDAPEYCSGVSLDCPSDAFATSASVCRSAVGVCDAPESCSGSGAACPSDTFVSGTECRASSGVCDQAESCGGSSADCPADSVLPSGAVCRAAAGECDLPDSCDGVVKDCAGDARVSAGEACTTDTDDCTDDICDGSSTTCQHPFNAAPCDDEDPCTLGDQCSSGVCEGTDVIVKPACDWVLIGGNGADPAKPKQVGARLRENATVEGDVCGATVRVGEGSKVDGNVVATESNCDYGKGAVQLGPDGAGVLDSGDAIVTGGGPVIGKPRLTAVQGYPPEENIDRVECGIYEDPPLTEPGYYDTTGLDPLVAECDASRASLASYITDLDTKVCDAVVKGSLLKPLALGDEIMLQLGPTFPANLEVGGAITTGELNYVCVNGNLVLPNNGILEIDGGGSAATEIALIVTGKIDLKLKSQIRLTGSLAASRLLIYGKKQCKIGDQVVGNGSFVCPNSRMGLRRDVIWTGALLSGKGYVQVGNGAEVTHSPLMFTE